MNSEYPYLTELDIQNRIHNLPMKVDYNPKFYFYPDDEVFSKEMVKLNELFEDSKKMIYDFYSSCRNKAILAERDNKSVDELEEIERIGILIGAGIPFCMKSDGMMTSMYDVKITKVDNKFHVFYKFPEYLTY